MGASVLNQLMVFQRGLQSSYQAQANKINFCNQPPGPLKLPSEDTVWLIIKLFICNTYNLTMQLYVYHLYSYSYFHCTTTPITFYIFLFFYVIYHLYKIFNSCAHNNNCPHLDYYTLYRSITLVSAD